MALTSGRVVPISTGPQLHSEALMWPALGRSGTWVPRRSAYDSCACRKRCAGWARRCAAVVYDDGAHPRRSACSSGVCVAATTRRCRVGSQGRSSCETPGGALANQFIELSHLSPICDEAVMEATQPDGTEGDIPHSLTRFSAARRQAEVLTVSDSEHLVNY
jgi:hypothetical protein